MLIIPPYIAHIDLYVAIPLSFCLLVGLIGNLLAFLYFCRDPQRSLSTLLYTTICAVDFCTCTLAPAVIMSLVSGRNPRLFGTYNFCAVWALAYDYCQRISMFLVMLMSVSRCIAVIRPFAARRKRPVFGVLIGYIVFISLHNVVDFVLHSVFWYGPDVVYCFMDATRGVGGLSLLLSELLFTVEMGLPILLACISFLLTTVTLLRMTRSGSVSTVTRRSLEKSKRASVTITIFTGLVLVCNLPYFVGNFVYAVSKGQGHKYPGSLFGSPFMFWYSWLVFKVILVVLNASTNPVLYFWRMGDFRKWVMTGRRAAPRTQTIVERSVVERSVVTIIINRIPLSRFETSESML